MLCMGKIDEAISLPEEILMMGKGRWENRQKVEYNNIQLISSISFNFEEILAMINNDNFQFPFFKKVGSM